MVSKYDDLKFFKKTKARTNHICSSCDAQINQGETYYSEEMKNRFLHTLHRKKLCKNCYEKIDK